MRTQWTALAAALVVLAGVVVTWAVSSAGRRVQVVQVAQQVEAGTPIEAADLITAAVAFDPGVEGLVPAASLDALLGRIAAIDLQPGVLLQRGMWREGESLVEGERAVGAVLSAGRFPPGLAPGDLVIGAPLNGLLLGGLDNPGGTSAGTSAGLSPVAADGVSPDGPGVVMMRVLDVSLLENGSVTVSLAVTAAQAVAVAQLAATDQLVIVRLPAVADTMTGSGP